MNPLSEWHATPQHIVWSKNCVILCIQCKGEFISLDGQDYDTFDGIRYTEDEAVARIVELSRENPETRYQVIKLL